MKVNKSTRIFLGAILVAAALFPSFSAFAGMASGTGFFISTDGHIITNAHVIEGAIQVVIKDAKGSSYPAEVVTVDEHNDLALLKIDTTSTPLSIGSSLDVDKGEKVYTLGFPDPLLQGSEAKYTEGVISSFSGVVGIPNTYQITTPIQGGNSGGPLLTAKGLVVGVIVSKLVDVKKDNVAYAIKSDYITPLLRSVPKTTRTQLIKARTVSDVERSVVMILAKTNEKENPKTATADTSRSPQTPPPALPTPTPSPSLRPKLNHTANVVGPDIAENGCVVPMNVSFQPALVAGEFFTVLSGRNSVAKVDVDKGSLSTFQFRVRMTGSDVLSVQCESCTGSTKFVQVKQACNPDPIASGEGLARVIFKAGQVKTLLSGNYPDGVISLLSDQANIRVSPTEFSVLNPYIGFGDFDSVSKVCIRVSVPKKNIDRMNCL